LHQQMQLVFV